MRKILANDHPLYHPQDPDGYMRFNFAYNYTYKKNHKRNDPQGSAKFAKYVESIHKINDSHHNGDFIETYLNHKEDYLDKKAIKKFFKKRK